MSQVRPAPDQGRFPRSALPASGARALAVLLGAMAVAPCIAEPSLPLAEAERLAIERDAVLRQLTVESAGMREQAIAERQLMDPRLRVGAVNVPVNDFSFTEEDMTMVEVGVSQEFPGGRTRELASKRMSQIANASESLASDRRLAVQREVRRVWIDLAYLAAARDLVAGQQAWVDQMRASSLARYASGEGKQLDLDRDETMQRAKLARWLGEDDAGRAGPFAIPARAQQKPLAELERDLQLHPSQVDFERRIEAAQTAVDLARQASRPGWMLDVSYGFRGGEMDGEDRPDMLSAMVSVDLPIFKADRQNREVAAARAEAQGLHEMHTDHQREMRAMLAEAWGVVQRTGELEQFFETELLPLADQSVQAALLGYRSNRAMVDEVVAARRAALDAKLKHLRLAAERAQAQYDMDYLVGEAP